jgi:hypothetical protein
VLYVLLGLLVQLHWHPSIQMYVHIHSLPLRRTADDLWVVQADVIIIALSVQDTHKSEHWKKLAPDAATDRARASLKITINHLYNECFFESVYLCLFELH